MKKDRSIEELVEAYSYEIMWSAEDDVFVARAEEWDFMEAHGDTQYEALEEVKEAVAFAIEEARKDETSLPVPYGERDYSGRFNVRIPPSLHRELSREADRQGVSLNQLVTTKLAKR